MEYALGVLMWSPKEFWEATMHELMAANKGYVRANKIPDDDDVSPLTRDEFEELKRLSEQRQKAKENGDGKDR